MVVRSRRRGRDKDGRLKGVVRGQERELWTMQISSREEEIAGCSCEGENSGAAGDEQTTDAYLPDL